MGGADTSYNLQVTSGGPGGKVQEQSIGNRELRARTRYRKGRQEDIERLQPALLSRKEKKEREGRVVDRLLPQFNIAHGTSLDRVYIEDPKQQGKPLPEPIDVLACSSTRSGEQQAFQVTSSDHTEQHRVLNTERRATRNERGRAATISRIRAAIEAKAKQYGPFSYSGIVLVLEAWLGLEYPDLNAFKKREGKYLKQQPFSEIWIVSLPPGNLLEALKSSNRKGVPVTR